MEEIIIKIRGRNEKYKYDAIQCVASTINELGFVKKFGK